MATSPDDPALRPQAPSPRIYRGEGGPHAQVSGYTLLIPSDTDLPQREVLRLALVDVIGRNGRIVDDKLIGEILDTYAADGGYDFNRIDSGIQESKRRILAGNTTTSFEGYSINADEVFQNGVLTWVDAKYPQLPLGDTSPEAKARIMEALKNLKSIAEAMGNGPAKEAIDAITQSVEAGDGSALNGVGGAAAAFKTVIELTKQATDRGVSDPSLLKAVESLGGVQKLGADASELLGRTASILTLPVDATKLGVGFYRLTQGKNEKGEPLSGEEYFKLATDLVSDGLSTAAGTAELLAAFGKGGAAAQTLAAWAPPVAAVTAWAKLNYEVVKLGGQAIQSTMEYEVAQRFAEGKDGRAAFLTIEREKERVASLPMGANNARRSAESIINNFTDQDTRGRFIEYLKRNIEPDDYITKIASTRGGETIPGDQMQRLARQIQQSYPKFIQAEMDDVKNFVLQKQEGLVVFKTPQQRGEYLAKPQDAAVVDVTKPATTPKPVEKQKDGVLPSLLPEPIDVFKGVLPKPREEPKPAPQSSLTSPGVVDSNNFKSMVASAERLALPKDVTPFNVAIKASEIAQRENVNASAIVQGSRNPDALTAVDPGLNIRTSTFTVEDVRLMHGKATLASLDQRALLQQQQDAATVERNSRSQG